ncbi:MAG: hypothetical protein QOH29_2701 [Actinomycetota bacterium]|nr:hypothetical protein [Actinomycetota bacterium]
MRVDIGVRLKDGEINVAHFVLVPGFWLGSWAWDDVARPLRDAGHTVTAVTLPGLESRDVDRSTITLADHVAAVAHIVEASSDAVILVAHSGAGVVVSAVVDEIPENVAVAVYADSGPLPDGLAINGDLSPEAAEVPLPSWAGFRADGTSLDGLDDELLARFAAGALPHPAGPVREALALTNPARFDVPIVLIASSFSAAQIRELAAQGMPYFAEVPKFEQVTIVELPTGHWPMFSRPDDLAVELEKVAAAV